MKDGIIKTVLYVVALTMGIVTLILSWTGLPGNFDTEPLLAIGVLCLALVGLLSIKK